MLLRYHLNELVTRCAVPLDVVLSTDGDTVAIFTLRRNSFLIAAAARTKWFRPSRRRTRGTGSVKRRRRRRHSAHVSCYFRALWGVRKRGKKNHNNKIIVITKTTGLTRLFVASRRARRGEKRCRFFWFSFSFFSFWIRGLRNRVELTHFASIQWRIKYLLHTSESEFFRLYDGGQKTRIYFYTRISGEYIRIFSLSLFPKTRGAWDRTTPAVTTRPSRSRYDRTAVRRINIQIFTSNRAY